MQDVTKQLRMIADRVAGLEAITSYLHPWKIYQLPRMLRDEQLDTTTAWRTFRVRGGQVLDQRATGPAATNTDLIDQPYKQAYISKADRTLIDIADVTEVIVPDETEKYWFWIELAGTGAGETAEIKWSDDPTTNGWASFPDFDGQHIPIGYVDTNTFTDQKFAIVRQYLTQEVFFSESVGAGVVKDFGGFDDVVRTLAFHPRGRIGEGLPYVVVGGDFTHYGQYRRAALCALNVDLSLNPVDWYLTHEIQTTDSAPIGGIPSVHATQVVLGSDPDGSLDRIYIRAKTINCVNDFVIGTPGSNEAGFAALKNDGTLQRWAYAGGGGDYWWITNSLDTFQFVLSDARNGTIYVSSGDVLDGSAVTQDNQRGAARYNFDPNLSNNINYDDTWDSTPFTLGGEMRDLIGARGFDSGDTDMVYICGNFNSWGATTVSNYVARIQKDSTIDVSFDTSLVCDNPISKLKIADLLSSVWGDRLFIGGTFAVYDGETRQGIALLETDGNLNTDFVPDPGLSSGGGSYDVYDIYIQSDGKPIVCGSFDHANGVTRSNIARFNTDGSIDLTFNVPSVNGPVRAITPLATDGSNVEGQNPPNYMIGGEFTSINSKTRNRIAVIDGVTGALLGP